MKAKSTTSRKNKKAPNAESVDDCYLHVKTILDFYLSASAMRNISASPGHDGVKPVVELCGTVNFLPTKTFATEKAHLVLGIKDGSHKLVNNIKVVPASDLSPSADPEDILCCCGGSGCANLQVSQCPPCD
jgi:hypothetical protein